ADAVGLVDGKGPYVDPSKQLIETGEHETLGGNEQQADGPLSDVHFIRRAFRRGLAAVDLDRRNTAGSKAVHLILHERDERRNNDGGIATQDGRSLITERLAAAGR